MNTIAWVILVAVLACGTGCAKPDWIEQTLVTVDVTGTWAGMSPSRPGALSSFEVRLELEQTGAKVVGRIRVIPVPQMGHAAPEIEGTVAGDVFRFKQTNGTIVGDMTVSGDEMVGYLTFRNPVSISLRRIDSSASPRSQ